MNPTPECRRSAELPPDIAPVIKSVRSWLKSLLNDYPDEIPGEIVSGPPLRAKCQNAWFGNISALLSRLFCYLPEEVCTDELKAKRMEADQLVFELQKRRTDPETNHRLTTAEDIERGNEILRSFINEINRILLPSKLIKYKLKMQSLLDDYKNDIPDELRVGPPLEYKCQWKWFQAMLAEIANLQTYSPDKMKTDEFETRVEEAMKLIQSLHEKERDPNPKFDSRKLTTPKDIEKANELLRFFIGEIDRILDEMQ